ncbi:MULTISPECIES: hypothetical protein [unclassified Streptomyces]|uniref:hypothetical protein n=1 Tax=unclassified Streptomyces TaxID=2593676 RepID=UPI001EF8FD42|nr:MULTISPECIES: hypothetical protein [unclassified Streptomyces]
MTEQNTTGAAPASPEDAVPQPAVATDAVPDAAPDAAVAAPAQAPEPVVPAQAAAPAVESAGPATEGWAAPAAPVAPADAAAQADAFAADPLAANPFAAPEVPAAPKDRRKLFAALRWTAAVLVFGAVGTGVAYEVTQPERTDIPGLSTKADGRWTYPALAKPVLPPGAALPFAKDNPDGIHYAGLTELLLPAPTGSTPDSALKLEKDGVVTVDTFLEEYDAAAREKLKEEFGNEGLRQITARGWTTPDGTRTRVYLLRFHASGFVDKFGGCGSTAKLNGVVRLQSDEDWRKAKSSQRIEVGSDGAYTGAASGSRSASEVSLYKEAKPTGDEQTALGCLQAGDVQAVILQNRKGEVATVPFHQTVILQYQLLG